MKKIVLILITLLLFEGLSAQKLKKLGIEFESTSYNFGDIQMWENQPAVFSLTNKSKHPISILPLFSESDLEIIYPEESIQPGETAIIKAIYYTGGTGQFSRKFPIYFNSSPEAYNLKITGNIKSLSPTAYIQCPQAKPEHSKPKMELFGNVAEIDSEIPLSGAEVKIISLSSKTNLTFYADKNGNFGSNLPGGNYEVIASHPNYVPYQSFFFLGKTSGHLKIRLKPIPQEPVLAQNTPLPKSTTSDIEKKQGNLESNNEVKTPEPEVIAYTPKQEVKEPQEIEGKTAYINENLSQNSPEKSNTFDIEDDIPYPNKFKNQEVEKKEPEIKQTYTKPTYTKETTYQTPTQITTPQNKDLATISPPKETTNTPTQTNTSTREPYKYDPYKTYDYTKPETNTTEPVKPIERTEFTPNKSEEYKYDPSKNYNYTTPKETTYTKPKQVTPPIEKNEYKKKDGENDELLSQLSFDKTDYNIIDEDKTPENTPSKPEKKTETPIQTNTPEIKEEITAKEPESVEETVAETLTLTPPSITQPEKKEINLDSIQRVLAEIEAEKLQMELALAKKELELSKKETLLAQQESELAKKDAELGSKNNELKQVKTDYNATQNELENKKKALEELALKEAEKEKPESLELSTEDYAANNVLFLIDISSSMGKGNKMELLKESIKSLAVVLREIDRVAIIAYNQKSTVILESVSGDNKSTIINAVDSLQNSGLTYGVAGLQTAYDLLEYNYIGEGNNQIILATDGLFSSVNNSMTENELNREVRNQVDENNIKLSVIGFGQDEEGDKLMTKLAENGEGQFIKIKNPWEAKTVLVDEIKVNSKK